MCGIAGILNFNNSPIDKTALKRMGDIMLHRGPDEYGEYIDNNVGLIHQRLSIIDLSSGQQPMYSNDGKYVIVFNGEIYNFQEIRDRLRAKNYSFQTNSDTEVVLKSFIEWGEDCVNEFNGMWAFAILNTENKQLFLSRDRLGEKPLFYYNHGGQFIFSSEIKSIEAYLGSLEVNSEMLKIYFSIGYVPAPYSLYKNVNKLLPGHKLLVKNESVIVSKYWELPDINESNLITDKNLVHNTFQELLEDSVRLRMIADVPFGAFLSGGLDSASVVAIMSSISEKPIHTFTMGFAEKAYDESDLAKKVSDKFSTKHHHNTVKPDHFDDALKKVLFHYDEPFGDPSAIPTGLVSKFASEEVKMVLTGDGGDEVLSGYSIYQSEKMNSKLNAYKNILPLVSSGINTVSKITKGGIRYKLNRTGNLLNSASVSFEDRLAQKLTYLKEGNAINDLIEGNNHYEVKDYINDKLKNCRFSDSIYRLNHFHLKGSLPEQMLTKVDRMSMAHSIETRVPFLDHRLVEFMYQVDFSVKMKGYERKSVLRNTIGKKLPVELLNAPKKGFSVPLREWFKGNSFSEKLNELTSSNNGLNNQLVSKIIDDNRSGKKDNGNFIWQLFLYQAWLKKNKQ
ncbi:asparagine synthase (glutamine-hydrolyzing) [Flavobacteriales bacterium]|nr:asparagine synthase (glutamine-hydrolyzing) [Flavobacteriales bacterium]